MGQVNELRMEIIRLLVNTSAITIGSVAELVRDAEAIEEFIYRKQSKEQITAGAVWERPA